MAKEQAPQLGAIGAGLPFRVAGGRGGASDSGANGLTVSALLFAASEAALFYFTESPQETLNSSIAKRFYHGRSSCSSRNKRPERLELAAEVRLRSGRMAAARGHTHLSEALL